MLVVISSKSSYRVNWLTSSSFVIALLLALPIFVIAGFVFSGSAEVFTHMYNTVLFDYVSNSILLMLGVGFGVLLLGIPTAWLTSVCDFPGRKIFAWALLLPLAVPAYIIAYTYTGLLDFAGPVQKKKF
jgi:iron(III) transport system permease protein